MDGQGDGGHSYDQPRTQGKDGVFPPLAILLLPGGASLWRGLYWDQSLKTGTFLVKIICLYVEQAASPFALGSFFSLALDLICTSLLIKTN